MSSKAKHIIDMLEKDGMGRREPRTDAERKARHSAKFGTTKLPPRGTGRKMGYGGKGMGRMGEEKDQVTVKDKRGNEMKADVVNPDDLFGTEDSRGPFWKKTYLLQLSLGGVYVINADHEQDAIDYFIDWAEDNAPGYLFSREEEEELDDDEKEDYIIGGNAGSMMNEPVMREQMYEIDPKPLIAQHFGGESK